MNVQDMRTECKSKFGPGAWIAISSREVLENALRLGRAPDVKVSFDVDPPADDEDAPEEVETVAAPAASTTGDKLTDALAEALGGRLTASIDEDKVREIVAEETGGAPTVDEDKVRELIREAMDEILSSSPAAARSVKLAAIGATASKGGPAAVAMARYAMPGAARRPVLLAGPAGSGKTTAVRIHGEVFPHFYEHQCAPDDDKVNTLGGPIPNPDGEGISFAWADSVITQAFRAAASGEHVCLLIDEIYRLPRTTREAMLSALAPTLDKHYVLVTGRPTDVTDGVAEVETLRVPVANLAIIATTNAGVAYGLTEACPAEAERWGYTYCPTDWPSAQEMLEQAAKDLEWDDPATTAKKLVEVGNATERLKESCELWCSASLRTLMRALEDSTPNDLPDLINCLMLEGNIWAAKDGDGKPVEAQVTGLRTAIEAVFS